MQGDMPDGSFSEAELEWLAAEGFDSTRTLKFECPG